MNPERARAAARLLWTSWDTGGRLPHLPPDCRPSSLKEGYGVQSLLEEVSGSARAGWKIAATNVTGQRHIGVDGPIAGRLLSDKLVQGDELVPMDHNHMRVAEAEFAFVMGRDVPPDRRDYTADEILASVESLHPAIELPDSRFEDFVTAGGPQLAADDACAGWFKLGPPAAVPWRAMDLAAHPVALSINDAPVSSGHGADVLGSPLVALAWLASTLHLLGTGLLRGDIVTTGVCGRPAPIEARDRVRADFGSLGGVDLRLGG